MKFFSLIIFIFLSACSSLPFQGPLKQPRTAMLDEIAATQPATIYPTSSWWKQYQDSQLNGLIAEGLACAPTIALAEARLKKAEAGAEIAGASRFPAITGDGMVQKNHQSYNNGVPRAFVPRGFQDAARISLNFKYEFDFWGKHKHNLAAALSEHKAAWLDAEHARLMLSTSIAATYAQLIQLYEDKDSALESIQLRQKTVDLFQARLSNGLENNGSVEQAKANLAASEVEMAALDEMIGLSRNRLAVLVGSTPLRVLSITRPPKMKLRSVQTPYPVPSDFIGHRPDLIAARLKLEAAAARIHVAASGFYPNIDLSGFAGRQSLGLDTFFKSGSFIGALGPSVHLPIFQGGSLIGQYKGARADYEASLAQYEYVIGEALYEVANAVTSQKSLGTRVQKTRAAFAAAKKAYEVAHQRYKGGLANYLEVLRAEDSLVAARRSLADIEARAFVLDVALIKALGGGFVPPVTEKES